MSTEILYLFGHSPRVSNRLGKLVQVITNQKNDGHSIGVAFLHDGVVGTTPEQSIPKEMRKLLDIGCRVFALEADLMARGLHRKELAKGIETINYDTLMELIVNSKSLCSWM